MSFRVEYKRGTTGPTMFQRQVRFQVDISTISKQTSDCKDYLFAITFTLISGTLIFLTKTFFSIPRRVCDYFFSLFQGTFEDLEEFANTYKVRCAAGDLRPVPEPQENSQRNSPKVPAVVRTPVKGFRLIQEQDTLNRMSTSTAWSSMSNHQRKTASKIYPNNFCEETPPAATTITIITTA